MAKQTTQTTATQTTPAAAQAGGPRVVVRGTNAAGARVRKVHTLQGCADMAQAAELAGPIAEKLAAGLENVYYNVYPPVGELCNGGLSKGFALVGGLVVKQVAAPAAAAPTAA